MITLKALAFKLGTTDYKLRSLADKFDVTRTLKKVGRHYMDTFTEPQAKKLKRLYRAR